MSCTWHSRPTAVRWPPLEMTRPCGCTTWLLGELFTAVRHNLSLRWCTFMSNRQLVVGTGLDIYGRSEALVFDATGPGRDGTKSK